MKNIIRTAAVFTFAAVIAFSMVSCKNAESDYVLVIGGKIKGASYNNNETGVFPEGRTVTLNSFYMGRYEVTQAKYKSVMEGQKVAVDGKEYTLDSSPSCCTGSNPVYGIDSGKGHSNYPVENVSWYDAVYYCNSLSLKEGLNPCYTINVTAVEKNHITAAEVTFDSTRNGYRLPTEAEWEYAARGGDPTARDWNYEFSGADTASSSSCSDKSNPGLDSVGWYCYNNKDGKTGDRDVTKSAEGKGTHKAGSKNENRLGLYDLCGNVWEWCWDWSGNISSDETVTNPCGVSSGNVRVYRGGCWYDYAMDVSVFSRGSFFPYMLSDKLGFRVCRNAF